MRLRALGSKATYAATAFVLAASLGILGGGTADAVPAQGCGATTKPILASTPTPIHHDSMWDGTGTVGQLYLGYFADCRGVYAEIHWNNVKDIAQQNYLEVKGRVYLTDQTDRSFGYVSFDHRATGQYDTSQIVTIDKDPSGAPYPAPKGFWPSVQLSMVIHEDAGASYTTCGPRVENGNGHDFSTGNPHNGFDVPC
ncbi:hypothetical protein AB0M29_34620 [Streptomyces sp. NPDC051976]|uniref:hypothetical protein n=1 Tax=Streptomyces sp. NPDC051976 TaxID=3154947 RepID=UPI0034313255